MSTGDCVILFAMYCAGLLFTTSIASAACYKMGATNDESKALGIILAILWPLFWIVAAIWVLGGDMIKELQFPAAWCGIKSLFKRIWRKK